ncbi:MAG TPA: cyclase family protein [Aggregatilineales bacterium]|nr:cyclase family protein [Aggregatilineales bacterium]
MHTADKRVQFDFEIDFSNGGGIQGQGFRLDIEGDAIGDQALADYIVRDMRLLMVGEVRILNKTIITEAHKRNRPALSVGTRLIDCSHVIEDGMITYKGLPAPIICDYLSREASRKVYAPGTEFHIGKIELVANTGTYIDSPFHRYADGIDIAALPLDAIANLPGVLVEATRRDGRAISREVFNDVDVWGKAVLIRTAWSAHWRTDTYFEGHPHLTADAAEFLLKAGAKLVGIDSYNIDNTDTGERPVHTALLGAGIPIVEHLCNLESVPVADFRFYAVPAPIKGMGTFPVRAFARVEAT